MKRTRSFMYVSEVARRAGESRDTTRRAIDSGELPALRLTNGTRLVDERDCDRYVAHRRCSTRQRTDTSVSRTDDAA